MAQDSSALLGKQSIILIVLVATLITGGVYGGYAKSNANNGVTCLSCLALNPSLSGGWSDDVIDHPQPVLDDLESGGYEIVMIFFWQDNCEACDEQWDAMKEYGLVTGNEKDGTGAMGAENKDQINLYVPDAREEPYKNWFNTYAAPFPRNTWGTPMTVLAFQHEGKTYWFSEIGPMTPSDIENLIHEAHSKMGIEHH